MQTCQQLGTSSANKSCNALLTSCYKLCVFTCVVYTRKNAQLVTNLQQTCSKSVATTCWQDMCSHWLSQACWQGCYKPAADLLQAWWTQQPCYKFLPTTCYRAVNNLWVTNLVQLDKITALLQTCSVTNLLRAQQDKLCVFACVEAALTVGLVQTPLKPPANLNLKQFS